LTTSPPLACTVRDCGLALRPHDGTYTCARGHSYDRARTGYINLLQPQDRRSDRPGDSAAAVDARARLLAAGIGRALIDGVDRWLLRTEFPNDAVIADLGSGSGDALAACTAVRRIPGVGIDLSTAAARLAARRFPHLTWVVANADRRLPFIDHGLWVLLSLHGRRNPQECARVLTSGGMLLVAVPAAGDLVELRTHVQGQRVERSRVDMLVKEHQPFFKVVERFSVREQHTLGHASLKDLLQSTYRGERSSAQERLASLPTMRVTLESDCVVFAPLRRGGRR
jgi:23S rRNA (guanine745-N1)-methyltransferase